MNSTIIFLSIFLIFLTILLKFKIDVMIDIDTNSICIDIYLYKIKVLNIQFFLYGLYYKINNSKKIYTLNLIISKKEKYLIKQLKQSILDKIYCDNFVLSLSINTRYSDIDAFVSMLFSIIVSNIYMNFYNVLKSKKIKVNNVVNYSENSYLKFQLNSYMTIFDLIFGIFLTIYKRGKYVG